jgi:DNA invertase Pin-like site-specific DNA recombinase
MRVGYSYLRYSSPQQGDGDSIRRQTQGTVDWCKRHSVQLDTGRTFTDRGKSAYRGKHRKDGGALAAFLSEVERGQIPRDSVLIIENLDRLSRENPWDAVPLLCSLVNAGISVVTLHPSEMRYERGSDLTALVLAVVEFGRSHSESRLKGERVGQAWAQKRRDARENHAILTKQLPGWVEVRGKKLALIPDRAAVVRRIFKLAVRGYGLSLIVRDFTQEKVSTWGRGGWWSKAYVHKILTSRAVLGELQPTRGGKPDGDLIPDYFPSVVDETLWNQAQAAMARRKFRTGPVGQKVATLFGGLLHDATTNDPIRIAWQSNGGEGRGRQKQRMLVTARSMEGAAPCVSFPHDVFEKAILSLLNEVNPAEVFGEEPQSESTALAAELAIKEERVRQIERELTSDGDDIPSLVRVLRSLSGECDTLRKRLAEVRQRESSPRSIAWAEAQTLLDAAKDEAQRLRLRELLRTVIDQIPMLIVRRRSHRLAVVQIHFQGGGRRNYLLWYRSVFGHERSWLACSLRSDFATDGLDLRRKVDVKDLTKTLGEIDVDQLIEGMRKGGSIEPIGKS